MARQEVITCDVDGCGGGDGVKYLKMQVVFETETNEGRAVDPYFSNVEIDLCKNCVKRLIEERKYLSVVGAMGFNKYYIK